ncbi:zinc ribbon domain-containing protein [Okeania sp. SIO2C9]|uniref:zinc ribbon domain-containing protein n=1 Tax=Okeania sp. SIO2C9 TaxID=2607791 RepID=UPI0025E3CB13|nr:zinc ribbon domain-containing protein [Okeania sp. SIO2C9]
MDKNYTSQECPKCGHINKKKLSERKHNCSNCNYQENRDVAAAKVIKNRGLVAVGRTVKEKRTACAEVSEGVKMEQESLWRW